jgi:hypothetical protein
VAELSTAPPLEMTVIYPIGFLPVAARDRTRQQIFTSDSWGPQTSSLPILEASKHAHCIGVLSIRWRYSTLPNQRILWTIQLPVPRKYTNIL